MAVLYTAFCNIFHNLLINTLVFAIVVFPIACAFRFAWKSARAIRTRGKWKRGERQRCL